MMIHTEQDALLVTYCMLLLVSVAVGSLCSLTVITGLTLKHFHSPPALYVSLALSALVSVPMIWLLISQWEEPPNHWDRDGASGLVFLLNVRLICFMWRAPICQYRLAGRVHPIDSRRPERGRATRCRNNSAISLPHARVRFQMACPATVSSM
jgi:hypothetical protein